MVFSGFGIVAHEYNRNDYNGLDIKDRTVVVMINDPGLYLLYMKMKVLIINILSREKILFHLN